MWTVNGSSTDTCHPVEVYHRSQQGVWTVLPLDCVYTRAEPAEGGALSCSAAPPSAPAVTPHGGHACLCVYVSVCHTCESAAVPVTTLRYGLGSLSPKSFLEK